MYRRVCIMAAVLSCLAGSISAQAPQGSIGLGVGIQSSVLSDDDLGFVPQFYIPIMLTDRIMLEPSIGLTRVHVEGPGDAEATSSLLRLGTGILFTVSPGADGHIYAGPRIGIFRFSTEVESEGVEIDESDTDLFLAGVIGGEYFLQRRFSLGGEVGLEWLKFDEDEDEDASLIHTLAEFRIRFYFR